MPLRLAKLPQAVLTPEQTAAINEYAITDFPSLEAIVGRELADVEREALTSIAWRHVHSRSIELASPTGQQTREHLVRMKEAAGHLRAVLSAKDATSTAFLAGRLITEQLEGRAWSRKIIGRIDVTQLALLMRDIEQACAKTERLILSQEAEANWKSWVHLISDLDAWAKGIRLKRGVSKRSGGKSGPLMPAPYQRLVQALIETFPPALRQHHGPMVTVDALAQAIYRARRDTKRAESD